MAKYFSTKSWFIPLSKQKEIIERRLPDWNVQLLRNGRLLQAIGNLKPDVGTRFFKVRIQLSYRSYPKVHLLGHSFQRDSNDKLPPHLYKDLSLCIFYPEHREWKHSMALATTIIPWTLRWLFHYEIWCETEVWIGGGTVHDSKFRVSKIELPMML